MLLLFCASRYRCTLCANAFLIRGEAVFSIKWLVCLGWIFNWGEGFGGRVAL